MQAREVYFKYFSSQRMAHAKSSVRCRAEDGGKVLVLPQSTKQPSTPPAEKQRAPQLGKAMKKIKKSKVLQF